ncbi:MAG TPA: UPF0182 family protein, partial [Thermoleophilia bacterium]|nr:UPF0182 family protein [Thermoleophilia bacterium]
MSLLGRFRHQGEGDATSWVDRRRRRRRAIYRLVIAATAVIVAIVAVRTFMGLYVDWLWFGEVDLRGVFWRRAWFGLVLGPVFGVVFLVLIYGNVEIARRCAPKHQVFEGIADLEYVRADIAHWVQRMALVLTSLVAIAVGFGAAGEWLTFARALYATPFAAQDPVFHHDLSFYVFTLPAWQYVYSYLFTTLFVALVVAILVHLMMGSIELQMREIEVSPVREEQEGTPPLSVEAVRRIRRITGIHLERSAVAQLSALLGALFVLGGLGYLLKAWNLLLSSSGVVFGAGYTDVHVRLPIIRVLMVLALFLGAALIYNAARRRRAQWLLVGVGSWIVASILFLGIVPAAYQALVVSPNQLEKELPYVTANLKATRSAYDLTAISEAPFALKGDLSSAKLAANSGTVGNIRLWDPEALLR